MAQQFKTNTIGTMHTLNAFLPLVMAGMTKKIIVVTSQMGSPHFALGINAASGACYSISKAGLNMVVAKLAAERKYRDAGLTIVGISPGLMKTANGRKFIYFLISQSLCYPTAFFLGEDNSIERTIHYMILGNEDKIESVFRNGCVLRTCLD